VRAHYLVHRDYYLGKAAKRNKPVARSLNSVVAGLKDVPCRDCGSSFPPYVLDFDHVRGTKLFNLSAGLRRSELSILTEAAKCEIVCAN